MSSFLKDQVEKKKLNPNHCVGPFFLETKETRQSKQFNILKNIRHHKKEDSFTTLPINPFEFFVTQIKTCTDCYNVYMCKFCHKIFPANSRKLKFHWRDEHKDKKELSIADLAKDEKVAFENKAKVFFS